MILRSQETKAFDRAQTALAIPLTGSRILLSNIPEGTAEGERIGDQIHVQSIELNFQWQVADSTNTVRAVIVKLRDPGTDYLEASELFAQGTAYATLSPFNYNNRKRYNILWDSGPMTLTTQDPQLTRRVNISPKFPVTFQSGSSLIGQNLIYMYLVSDSAVSTHPVFTGFAQIKYKDG